MLQCTIAWQPLANVPTATSQDRLCEGHRFKRKVLHMSNGILTRGIIEFLDIVGSALAVSAATRDRRQARDADLLRLGIEPAQFRGIRRF